MGALLVGPDALLALVPDFLELRLHCAPVALQLLVEHRVDQLDTGFRLHLGGSGALLGETVDLLVEALDAGIVAVELLVEGSDYLLLLVQLLVYFGDLVLHHGSQDGRHLLPAIVLLLLLGVGMDGAGAAASHGLSC